MPLQPTDLATLAQQLLDHGPVRTLPTTKRLRIQLGGAFVADTTRGLYVWEHPHYPTYYVPLASLAPSSHTTLQTLHAGRAALLRLAAGPRSTDRVLAFAADLPDKLKPLSGMVRVEFAAVDAWFEEDAPVFVHPKDPFKRVDIVLSTRPVRVRVGGNEVAVAASAQHLFETGLPTRYYLPPTAVDPAVLRKSETRTRCPYKGEAEYYDVVVGEEVFKDVVWYYTTPTHESAAVAGLLCFYNEKVDIELDGEMLERPKTHFA
ncbi:hypothetical protein GTA08_BOTSDO12984 [Neofusicoccum parvum]|nr:hypothetical protein GTA08_BOTSDO12984 [Neofusicoccum parvum]